MTEKQASLKCYVITRLHFCFVYFVWRSLQHVLQGVCEVYIKFARAVSFFFPPDGWKQLKVFVERKEIMNVVVTRSMWAHTQNDAGADLPCV